MKNVFIPLISTVVIWTVSTFSVLNMYAQKQVSIASATELMKKNFSAIGLSPADVANTKVTDAYYDQLSGATMVYLQQTINGIDVYNGIRTVAFKNDKPVFTEGELMREDRVGIIIPGTIPALSAADALKAAAAYLRISIPSSFIPLLVKPGAGKETAFGKLSIAGNKINAKLTWIYSAKSNQMKLCWTIPIEPVGKIDFWIVKVDALNGQILGKDNLTDYDNRGMPIKNNTAFFSRNLKQTISHSNSDNGKQSRDITSATYRVIPYPAESPIHPGGTPALQTDPWTLAPAGSNATTLKWNYNGTTYFDSTRGNNVLVQEDHNADNGYGDGAHSSVAEPFLIFDYPPDFTKEPTDSVNLGFALTNLFYWANIMHDISYLYGFDEVSGNFQDNNLSRGGQGNDYLFADAQDGTGLNNSNFTTPSDGDNPRMQVNLFGGTPQLDADLDNGIICHEYGHGISRRLTGGPSNAGCLENKEQMGEGWSDYFALMVTTNWATAQSTDGTKKRPLATYSLNEPVTGAGWRRYPYSTDMATDPETYAYLTATGGEAHYIGEVWATVLWDMTWEIIQMDGINPDLYNVNGAGGNSVAMKLVMEGLKLQPCSPGFLDGRDAILKADTLLYEGKYSCGIWKAFSKRGMGLKAKQGSADDYTDQVADFSGYSSPYIINHVDKEHAYPGEILNYSITVTAPLCEPVNGFVIVDTLPANVTYTSSDGIYNDADKTVSISNINLNNGQSKTFAVSVKINDDSYFPYVQFVDDSVKNGSIKLPWETTSTTETPWIVSSAKSRTPQSSYFAKDSSGLTNATLQTLDFYTLKGRSILSFWQYYDIETGYDGGVADISLDSGKTWQDLGPHIIQNGYTGLVNPNTPLIGGSQAFTGNSNGAFLLTKIDLSSFTGKNIKIKFFFVSDESGGADGWYIDDINLKSEAAVFNSVQLFDNNGILVVNADTITTINNDVLPLRLVSFSGKVRGTQNLLHWTTASEQNNAGFEIQYSTEGIHYDGIGFINSKAIDGRSNDNISYDFVDEDHSAAINYYRLKQINKNGKYSYSNIVVLKIYNIIAPGLVAVYPNPAKNVLNVKIASATENRITIKITDLSGRLLQKKTKPGGAGETVIHLDISHLSAGPYSLKILSSGDKKTFVTKFVKE